MFEMNKICNHGLSLAAAIALCFVPGKAYGINITFERSFSFNGPDGITFDPNSGHLFVVQEDEIVTKMTISGEFLSSFTVPNLDLDGLSLLPNGNLLLAHNPNGEDKLIEFTTDGVVVSDGINISLDAISNDPDGVIFNPVTETIFLADQTDKTIYEISTEGNLLSKINTLAFNPNFDNPEGITVDPLSGNLLVVDDAGGTNSLYEITPTGKLVSSINLLNLSNLDDPEGITIDGATRTLYVAFDKGGENGDQIGVFKVTQVPEFTSVLSLLTVGLLGIISALKHKHI